MTLRRSPARRAVWLIATAAVASAGVAVYVAATFLGRSGTVELSEAAFAAEGQQIYRDNCASCHGANLEGQPNWRAPLATGGLPAPPHDETGHTWHHPDQQLFAITKFGGQRFAPTGFQSNMPAFQGQLSDREITAALAFIKSQWPANVRERQRRITERTQ